MSIDQLPEIALAMVARGKGIIAIDESNATIKKRFDGVGVECTEENRRAYREMLLTTPGLGDY
ncbi:MAG: class I fructose-bisphosphate aldolase, partial [Arenimonas sp.]